MYNKLFNHYWNPYTALGLAGILSAIYFGLTNSVWAVTGEFTRIGGELLELFGVDISGWEYFNLIHMDGNTWTRPDGWIVWGMFIGAFIMILLGNNFKIRLPRQKRRLIQGLAGGIIAGFGARLAMGCNLAAFFTGVPQFSIHSWIFMVATGLGTYIGVKITSTKWWKGKPVFKKGNINESEHKPSKIQPYIGMIAALAYMVFTIYLFAAGSTRLGIAAAFGAAFGILIERGQICFTSAFRDIWISGRAKMARAIIFGMAISSIITIIYIVKDGLAPITQIAAPSTFIGGTLFGLGIVLATSCETGMMYRVMEGQVLYLTVFIGNIIGSTMLAYAWDHMGIFNLLVNSGSRINLVSTAGSFWAITLTLLMLAGTFIALVYWQKHFHFGVGFKREAKKHAS